MTAQQEIVPKYALFWSKINTQADFYAKCIGYVASPEQQAPIIEMGFISSRGYTPTRP